MSKTRIKRKSHRSHKTLTRITALILAAVLLVFCFDGPEVAPRAKNRANSQKLTLASAKEYAIAKSTKIEALEMQIEAKKAAKTSAEKSIKQKQKNMASFRWTPLLNFKLPEKPNEAQSYEFQFKPKKYENEIETLNHKISDQKLAEYEKVSNLFVTIVKNEELIDFYERRVSQMKEGIGKLKARVKIGTATEGDVSKAQAKLKQMESKLAKATTKYETSKIKLSNMMGLDVTKNYSFENPFVTAELQRSALDFLQEYAKERDESLYEAKQDEALAMFSLTTNETLMSNFYGSNYNMIKDYVTKVKTGGDIDKRAFKKKYDEFLVKVDDPWTGNYKIWFIKFPKEWLKGSLDGTRYVEDEPYVLYENALDYQSARKDREAAEKDLKDAVDEGFENYAESRKAYLDAVQALQDAQEALIMGDIDFLIGEISEEEYKDLETAVNDATVAEEEMIAAYSETTYSYDRTCCGGVSAFFAQQNVKMTSEDRQMGLGVDNTGSKKPEDLIKTLVPVFADGITYSLDLMADEQLFELRVDVPEGFSVPNVNYYELWCDNIQVGARTAVNRPLRHMRLSTSEVSKCEIRFYSTANGKTSYLSNAIFDPTVLRGNLQFTKGYNTFTEKGLVAGLYEVQMDTKTGTFEVKLRLTEDFGVKKFAVKNGNVYKDTTGIISTQKSGTLYLKADTSKQYSQIDEGYSYLDAVSGDLEDLTIVFMDDNGTELFEAIFVTEDQTIVVPKTQLEYVMDWQTSN